MGKAYASLYHMRHVKLHRTNWIAVNQGHKKTKTGLTFAKYIYCDLQFVRYSQVQVQLPCNFPKPNPSTSRGSTFLRLRLKFLSSLLVTFSTPSIKANASRSTLAPSPSLNWSCKTKTKLRVFSKFCYLCSWK